MWPAVETARRAWLERLPPRLTSLVLVGLPLACIMAGFWEFQWITRQIVQLRARDHAALLAKTVLIVRRLYTDEVVQRAQRGGVEARSDYTQFPEAIPLPATFTHLLGCALSAGEMGETVRLTSPYPYGEAVANGGLQDGFQRSAWTSLGAGDASAFMRIEQRGGEETLRYAVPDRMEAACLGCHNQDPRSPKRDWQAGDLAGMAEVTTPLRSIWARPGYLAPWLLLVLTGMSAGGGLLGAVALASARRSRQAAREAENRLQLLASATASGMVTFDAAGRLLGLNPAAESIFSTEAGQAAGQHVSDLLPECHPAVGEAATGLGFRLGGPYETVALGRGPATIPVELTVLPLATRPRTVFVALVRDLRELKRLQEMKDAFASTLTHELKGPLHVLNLAMYSLKKSFEDKLDERRTQLVEVMSAKIQWMIRLVMDVLTYERCREGRLSFEPRPVDLLELVGEALESYRELAIETGVRVRLVPPGEPVVAFADRDQILRVVENLLSNAVKFSPRDSTVELSLSTHDGRARVSVLDQGEGIPETARQGLFTRFRSADPDKARLMASTGLGLSLSKAIIAQHGGTIGFEPNPAGGTRFYFELPVASAV